MSVTFLTGVVAAIRAAAPPKGMKAKIIGIDGCGASGKSTLASKLAPLLHAPIIQTDDFAQPDIPLDWHARFEKQVITPLRNNLAARYQRYDWATDRLTDWLDVPARGYIIIEGVSATRALFRPALAYCIYVDAPREVKLQRGLARDGDGALNQWLRWQAEEDRYVAVENPAASADLLIDGTSDL